jgi:hypothetical protein
MANWCQHCTGNGPYYCNIADNRNSKISDYMVKNYCMNNGYKCPTYEKNGSYSGGGCFITTITCEILNKNDKDPVMQELRKFRDEVLQNDKEHEDLLKSYDVIGPMLARRISLDENKEKIANVLFDSVLEPISSYVKEEKNEEAIEAYYQMTLLLINYYGLKHPYNYISEHDFNYKQGEFDRKTAGHGKKIRKTLD